MCLCLNNIYNYIWWAGFILWTNTWFSEWSSVEPNTERAVMEDEHIMWPVHVGTVFMCRLGLSKSENENTITDGCGKYSVLKNSWGCTHTHTHTHHDVCHISDCSGLWWCTSVDLCADMTSSSQTQTNEQLQLSRFYRAVIEINLWWEEIRFCCIIEFRSILKYENNKKWVVVP